MAFSRRNDGRCFQLADWSDPSAVNSNPPTNNVVIQTVPVANPVTIPEYSVVRLEWTVFDVPPPTLAVTVSNDAQNLQ